MRILLLCHQPNEWSGLEHDTQFKPATYRISHRIYCVSDAHAHVIVLIPMRIYVILDVYISECSHYKIHAVQPVLIIMFCYLIKFIVAHTYKKKTMDSYCPIEEFPNASSLVRYIIKYIFAVECRELQCRGKMWIMAVGRIEMYANYSWCSYEIVGKSCMTRITHKWQWCSLFSSLNQWFATCSVRFGGFDSTHHKHITRERTNEHPWVVFF